MASAIYNVFKRRVLIGEVDWDLDTFMCALLDNSYAINIDTHAIWGDVSGDEITGTGYIAGGATISGVTVTLNLGGDQAVITANDVTWASSTITARWAIVYKYDATPSNRFLCFGYDFGSDKASNNGDFTVQWNASGMMDAT